MYGYGIQERFRAGGIVMTKIILLCVRYCAGSFFFFYKFIYFIYLFLAALGLCCCAQAFSSCSERGLLFIVVHGLLIVVAYLAVEHGL